MPQFPHLIFRSTIVGEYKGTGGGQLTARSKQNKGEGRVLHASSLREKLSILRQNWLMNLDQRLEQGKLDLTTKEIIPLFLQIDPNNLSPDFLFSLGIEVISEEEDGFIIGAALADLSALEEKVNLFAKKEGAEKIAELLEIEVGFGWRPSRILSDYFRSIWEQISDADVFVVDLGISCFKPLKNFTTSRPTSKYYERSLRGFADESAKIMLERIEMMDQRLDALIVFIKPYQGQVISSAIDLNDSFSVRIRVNGKGLKDLVFNFPYLFDVTEPEEFELIHQVDLEGEEINELSISGPSSEAARVCIIDSGIQENHRFLAQGILTTLSKNYIQGSSGVEDLVQGGGHGTRVAGAVLYPDLIPRSGRVQLPFWIVNSKVLDNQNKLPEDFPIAAKIKEIVEDLEDHGIRIFNHSLGTARGFNSRHMSVWGSMIDKLSFEKDVLFLISAGNIPSASPAYSNYSGILDFLKRGLSYPDYLLETVNRVCNPAHSIFGLTVGSIGFDSLDLPDHTSFSGRHQISSFSRTGFGIWNSIKPDVVEVGGDWVLAGEQLVKKEQVIPETIRSTYPSGPAIGRDGIGTSFATPKVTHIAGHLRNLFPNESLLFTKGLIIQSARWPEYCKNSPSLENLRKYGYGIPNLTRASENHDFRITFGASSLIKPKTAHLYTVKIPESLRGPGSSNNILIEVTLVYTSQPRRTRKTLRGYLGNLCEFEVSGKGQSFEMFKSKMIKEVGFEGSSDSDGSFGWTIGNRKDWGLIEGVSRKWSANQKDWALVPAYDLPKELSIAVISRPGWEKDLRVESKYSLFVSFEDLESQLNIYQQISLENQLSLQTEIEINI